ncbi:PKD domain-containing protein [Actinopolymorpha sp. B17G11]|uniref:PKD domain-containing protein n=1 Tax=Actinopolymorpha sp. B17G11 TaxID=3160861 RepID=UPI0032E4A0F3
MDRRADHPGLGDRTPFTGFSFGFTSLARARRSRLRRSRTLGSRSQASRSHGTHSVRAGALATGLLTALVLVLSGLVTAPAAAEVCENGRDPVTGQCQIGIPTPDPDPDPEPGGEPAPEPTPGQTKTAHDYRNPCDEVGVGCGVLAPCPGDDPVRYNHYVRQEMWNGSAWVPQGPWQLQPPPVCMPDQEPARPTEQQVIDAIVEFGLPGGRTELNPPGGRTLINLPTNFYTTRGAIDPFNLPVGPFTVQVRATPESYEWHFGGGESRTTSTPGAPYPDGTVLHTYDTTGTYQVSVTVHYQVDWQFGGDGWQTIANPIQAQDSPSVDLTVVESRAVLRKN